ncbi:cAMP-independent regulatory protein pac2, partial [Termitomyces sp. T112]
EFLYYNEKGVTPNDDDSPSSSPTSFPTQLARSQLRDPQRSNLVKQTYSVFVDTERGRRKWHLIAYFTQDTLASLYTVNDFPDLAAIRVPPGMYRSARAGNRGVVRIPPVSAPFPIIRTYHIYNVPYPSSPHTPTGHLAPLEYLRTCPPPRRHPLDEKALMSFLHSSTWVQ